MSTLFVKTIKNSIIIAVRALKSNMARTGLTTLGIVIGIASVIVVFSAGEGIRSLVIGQVEAFGTDILETEIKVPTGKKGFEAESQSGAAIAQGVQVTTLTLKDMEDINKLPNVKASYAGILSQEQVSYESQLRKAFLLGTSASYIDIDKSEIEFGRFFTEAEDRSLAQVAVLGSEMKEKLFGDSEAVGKSIKIRKSKYQVIGVMKERGNAGFMNFNDYVYVPVRTLQKKIMGIDHVLYMVHQLNDVSLADETAAEIRVLLRDNHNIDSSTNFAASDEQTSFFGVVGDKDDFRVVTMEEMISTLNKVTDALTILLLVIVAISLVVGGVGITNVMYVTVTERTAEIGLRKAVGAKFSDIMWQFLAESVLVTMAGGIIGAAIGVLISVLISFGAKSFGLDWRFAIPLRAFITAIGFSLLFGVLFGLYPARKAARLEPVEALRRE